MNWSDDKTYSPSYFFDTGLRFSCTGCGSCCVGDPGIVRVNSDEIRAIAGFLHLPREETERNFLCTPNGTLSIREAPDGRCIFYKDGCRIYSVRPRQCKTFPFWVKNLRSEDAWNLASQDCPGMNSGRLFTKEEILGLLE